MQNGSSYLHILIPAYNEFERLPKTLKSLCDYSLVCFERYALSRIHIHVIDDHSRDASFIQFSQACTQALKEHCPVYGDKIELHCYQNSSKQGKGQALNYLLEHASLLLERKAQAARDFVLLLDADLELCAGRCFSLLEPLIKQEADLVIAAFAKAEPEHETGHKAQRSNKTKKRGFGQVLKRARKELAESEQLYNYPQRYWQSPLSGQRALSLNTLYNLSPLAPGFAVELMMSKKAIQLHLRIHEMSLKLSHRQTGKSLGDILHRLRQYLDIEAALKTRDLAKHEPKAAEGGQGRS